MLNYKFISISRFFSVKTANSNQFTGFFLSKTQIFMIPHIKSQIQINFLDILQILIFLIISLVKI